MLFCILIILHCRGGAPEDVAPTFGYSGGTATVSAAGGFGAGTIPKTTKKMVKPVSSSDRCVGILIFFLVNFGCTSCEVVFSDLQNVFMHIFLQILATCMQCHQ